MDKQIFYWFKNFKWKLVLYNSIFIFILFIFPSDNEKIDIAVTQAESFQKLAALLKTSINDKNYLQLWNLLSEQLQIELNDFLLRIKKLDLSEREQIFAELSKGSSGRNNNFLKIVGSSIDKITKYDQIAIMEIYLGSKFNIFSQIASCSGNFFIPSAKESAFKSLENKKVSDLKEKDFFDDKISQEVNSVFYVCPGIRTVRFVELKKNDWRVHLHHL